MLRLFLLTALLGMVFFLCQKIGLSPYITAEWPYLLAFFSALGYANHLLTQQAFAHQRSRFVQFAMATLVIRLLCAFGFFFYVFFTRPAQPQRLLIHFFILYFLYAGFEMYEMYSNLRADSKNEGKS